MSLMTMHATAQQATADELLPRTADVTQVRLGALPNRPLVSIIVPSFNQGKYIRATVDSILSQNYRPLQIHVIDGGSKDESVDVLKSYGVIPELQWASEKDRGVVHAVNKGFARVQGDIVAIQSSDDTYLPGTISKIVDQFSKSPDLGLIYGDTVKIDAHGHELERYLIGPYSLENLFLLKTWIPQPSAFFRKEMLDVCGGWDEGIPYAPDTDLWIRMAFRTKVLKIDEFLSQRRIHEAQRDTQEAKIVRDFTKMIDQSRDLPYAPVEVQRAARAAKYLIRARYHASATDLQIAWLLIKAGIINSRSLNVNRITYFSLLPLRRFLSRIKRSILKWQDPAIST